MVRDIQPVHRSDPYPAWQQLLVNTLDNPELHPEIRQDITNALLFAGYLLAELDPPQRRTSSRLSSAHNKTSGAESPVRKISATGASVNKTSGYASPASKRWRTDTGTALQTPQLRSSPRLPRSGINAEPRSGIKADTDRAGSAAREQTPAAGREIRANSPLLRGTQSSELSAQIGKQKRADADMRKQNYEQDYSRNLDTQRKTRSTPVIRPRTAPTGGSAATDTTETGDPEHATRRRRRDDDAPTGGSAATDTTETGDPERRDDDSSSVE